MGRHPASSAPAAAARGWDRLDHGAGHRSRATSGPGRSHPADAFGWRVPTGSLFDAATVGRVRGSSCQPSSGDQGYVSAPWTRLYMGTGGVNDDAPEAMFWVCVRRPVWYQPPSVAGEMAERLKAHAWKACVRESVPRVRIPVSPPVTNRNPNTHPGQRVAAQVLTRSPDRFCSTDQGVMFR